jgi:Kef-type K+ transport system membrane component KefB/mannitol/fructose-specific phosphotransferase system IIA component (Ntr-type)
VYPALALTENDVLVFLLSLGVLLGTAKLFGEIARAASLPLVVGEIAAGILLGPTGLGHLAPRVHEWLFGAPSPAKMIGAFTSVAVVLLLVVAGIEVDLEVVKRRGRSALFTSALGIVLPLGGGLLLGYVLPDSDLVQPDHRTLFAVFLGVALSISALPVIAKTLMDLGLFRTEIGLIVMAAAMINDLVGWLAFSVLVGPMRGSALHLGAVALTGGLTIVFLAASLTLGRPVVDRLFSRIEGDPGHAPGRLLSVVILLALFGASATQAIGIHAVFGAFVVGVTVGDSKKLKTRTRVVIEDFVMNVFAPVFFASLGLRVDFVRAFDARLCVLVFGVATVAKVVGCSLGARAGGMPWKQAGAVGFGLNARGAMEIVLALVALDAGVIKEQLFVALVVMAIGTSLLGGPAMKALLYAHEPEEEVVTLLREGAFIASLKATTPGDAIHELVRSLGSLLTGVKRDAREAVLERERTAPTGLGDEVAIPHAAVDGLSKPVLALGLSQRGIDFDAPDGRPARIVFLLLMPPRAYEREVRVLASISRAVFDEGARGAVLRTETLLEAADALAKSAARLRGSMRPEPTSYAEM